MNRKHCQSMVRGLFKAGVLLALHAPVAWGQEADHPVASSGNVSVSSQEIQTQLAALPPAQREQLAKHPAALEQWVRARLVDKLLRQEASTQQWDKRPEVASQIEKMKQELVVRSYLASVSKVPDDYPTDTEVAAAYSRVKDSLLKPAGYRVSQVFLAAPRTDTAAQEQARKTATEVVKKARQPKVDFSKLALEYGKKDAPPSTDTGWVTLEQLLPEVRSVVARLKPGEVSEPVASAAGLHVLKLVDMRQAKPATLDESREVLKTRLRQERQSQIARAYLDNLGNAAAIKVDTQAVKAAQESSSAGANARQ